MLVLSIFPGIGMLDRALNLEGFTTVRGSDPLWGGDIRNDHYQPGKFDGVIGGPPCQTFSLLAHLVRANGHEPKFGNLIPEFERVVAETEAAWFLMENVPAAPIPVVAGYGIHSFELDNSMLPGPDGDGFGQEQRRVRRFSFGLRGREPVNLMKWIELAVFVLPDAQRPATQGTGFPHDEAFKARTGAIHAGHDQTPWERDGDKGRKTRHTAVNAGHDDPNVSLTQARREAKHRRSAVVADTRETPVAIGGSGKVKRTRATVIGGGTFTPGATVKREGRTGETSRRYRLADALRLQGLPEDFLKDAPFTAEGKLKAVANGVPIPMGRAIARAVKEAISATPAVVPCVGKADVPESRGQNQTRQPESGAAP